MRSLLILTLLLGSLTCVALTSNGDDQVIAQERPLPAYMIQHEDGRWLGKTLPGYINIWVYDRSAAFCWVHEQKAHRAWLSLGFGREKAEVRTFKLVPEDKE